MAELLSISAVSTDCAVLATINNRLRGQATEDAIRERLCNFQPESLTEAFDRLSENGFLVPKNIEGETTYRVSDLGVQWMEAVHRNRDQQRLEANLAWEKDHPGMNRLRIDMIVWGLTDSRSSNPTLKERAHSGLANLKPSDAEMELAQQELARLDQMRQMVERIVVSQQGFFPRLLARVLG